MYEHGWYQIAFERELEGPINPLRFGKKALMAVRSPDKELRIFDATCPHRGANLAYGGTLEGDVVRCPFHGLHIPLGAPRTGDGLWVREYSSYVLGGMVFVRLSEREQPDIRPTFENLAQEHDFFPGFSLEVKTPIEVVIENGWDSAHFEAVHRLPASPELEASKGPIGQLISQGQFVIPRFGWSERPADGSAYSRYRAQAFSPGLVLADLEGQPPFNYSVVTAATPGAQDGTCTIRLTLALPKSYLGANRFADSIIAHSRKGIEEDQVIWEQLNLNAPSSLTAPGDDLFRIFGEFCRQFGEPFDRRLAT